VKKSSYLLFVAAFAAGCATAQPPAPAKADAPSAAKADCAPPPKALVTRDLEKGTGAEAIQFRTAVLVGYTGWLYDECAKDHKGEKFDSSEGRPTPFGFVVGAGRVIKGWDEGLMGMQKGGKRLLVIPPDKAYGARSPSPKIPPNSTLVFEVTVFDIIGTPPAAKPAAPAAPKK
jgi:FKBP-type peptidyl-prolyl cis-trans isomerase FkpA